MKNIKNSFKKITALALIVALSFSFSVPVNASAACNHTWTLFESYQWTHDYPCSVHQYCAIIVTHQHNYYGCLKCGDAKTVDKVVNTEHFLYQ